MNGWSNGVKIAREHWLLIEKEKTVHERMGFRRCDETFHCYGQFENLMLDLRRFSGQKSKSRESVDRQRRISYRRLQSIFDYSVSSCWHIHR